MQIFIASQNEIKQQGFKVFLITIYTIKGMFIFMIKYHEYVSSFIA